MRLLTHIVAPEQEGWPLRRLLRQELRISGSFLSRLKWRPGAILVNGRPATVAAVLHTGDAVTADVSDLPGDNPHIRPVAWPLDILWEDEDLLVLNKPAGIAIHPAALTEETVTVAGAVCHYLGQGSFHCVNRLDRGTTGVMVVAKTGYVHRLCMEQLHSGDFRRTYLAVCSGVPSPAAGSIDLPIGREPDSLLRRRVDPAGLAAHTDYETLWQGPDRALLRLTDPEEQLAAVKTILARHLNVAQTEEYIENLLREIQTAPPRRRPTFILKDVRLFLNSLDRSLNLMRSAGVNAACGRQDTEDEILLTIRIPKARRVG